jgi:outer membrane protein assembly factor BamB
MVLCVTPNDDGGGIWMSGNGAAVDRSGKIYVTTSNGLFDAAKGGLNFRDSVLKLSASGKVLDYFSPKNQATLDGADLDLGVGGTVLLPDQPGPHPHLLVVAGKDGNIYLVDRDKMGHFDARVNRVVQEIPKAFTKKLGYSGGNFSAPVYFNGRVYFGAVNDNIQAFSLRIGRLSTKPVSRTAASFGSRGAALSVSAASATDPNGILWALQYNGSVKPGVLHAYRASDLRVELWNSNQAGSRDSPGAWTKFSVPTIANGKVYVAGIDRLSVYGLLPDAPPLP